MTPIVLTMATAGTASVDVKLMGFRSELPHSTNMFLTLYFVNALSFSQLEFYRPRFLFFWVRPKTTDFFRCAVKRLTISFFCAFLGYLIEHTRKD